MIKWNPRKAANRKLPDDKILAEMFSAGEKASSIAMKCGVHVSNVSRARIRINGIKSVRRSNVR